MAEIASHVLQEGMCAIRLHGGPWDGTEVGVFDGEARLETVNTNNWTPYAPQ